VGYSANAIRWQVWTALLVYVLCNRLSNPPCPVRAFSGQ
jgi:hypothetical protein